MKISLAILIITKKTSLKLFSHRFVILLTGKSPLKVTQISFDLVWEISRHRRYDWKLIFIMGVKNS
jgi:hypothetical protein